LERALRRQRDPRAGPLGGDRSGETGGAASDHEHVKREVRHDSRTIPR
jgi:hypothetical protein